VADDRPLFPEPMPPIGGPELQQKPKPAVPREVNIAFVVWVLSTLLTTVLQVTDSGAFVEEYLKQTAGTAQALSAGTLKTVYLVAVIAVGVLMLFFVWKMRSGRNWARILLAVLAVVGLLMQASAVGLSDIFAVIGVLITAAGLVFMFVPASNAYFAQFRRPPGQRLR
jgi:hypothetical protein